MALNYQTLSPNEKTLVLTQHMEFGMITQHSKFAFKIVFFKAESRKAISDLCIILGYMTNE